MGAQLEVRDGVADDAGALTRLLNEIIAAGGTTAMEEPLTPSRFVDVFMTGADCLACFVALDGEFGRPVGFQALARHPDLPDDWADIASFAQIRPKRPGVGSALFAQTARRARDLGLSAINATIRADNVGGLAYYGKMGFEPYRTLAAAPLKDGTPVDRVFKRYLVDTPKT